MGRSTINRLHNTELIDWGLTVLCFLWTVSYLFVCLFQNRARAAGWLQKAANSRPGFEAQTQNKETIPYTQPADGNPRPRLVLGQSKAGPNCPSATSRVVPTAHQHSCVSTKAAEVRTERAQTSPENLPPGSPCYGPESSSQPAVITSHRMFSSMVISTTSVRAVQDGSCL